MAQQNVGIGGQSQASSHSGGWAGSPSATVWDQTRNIVESVEGGASDFGSGRSAEWEVKNATWEWDQVGPVYSTRHLDVHSPAIAFASGGQTVDGLAGASPGTHGALVLKHDGVLHDNSHADSSRVGKLSSVEQHPPTQVSILSPDQRRRLALELGEGGSSTERRKNNVQDFGGSSTLMGMGPAVGGTSAAAAAAGTELNLKLGRNACYEETQGGRGAGSTPPASAPLALAAGAGPSSAPSAQAVYAVGPPGKKQRLPSPNVQVCQVDGCKQDLSGSKEYHKRHKVCETHSKAPRVVAGGMEQRFCQQCSRFHGLSEFDEGKRSCRRRLAGHNERRRKPPPEPASIASSGNSSSVFQSEAGAHGTVSIEERKRSNSGLAEQQACFITMQRTPGSSSTSVESDEQSGSLGTNFKLNHGKSSWPVLGRGDETTGLACQSPVTISERQPSYLSPVTERVLMFFQSPNGAIAGPGVHYPVESAAGSMAHGPGLTLASSSGPAGVLAGLDGPVSAHVSGMLDSGRALSLLSSHPRGSRVGGGASGSMSLAVSAAQSDVTLEQLISDDARNAFSPRGPQSRFHGSSSGSTDKLFRQPPREMQLSNPNRGGDNPPREQQQHRSLLPNLGMVGGYESHSMLSIMPEYRALQTPSSTQRPTIDLMQLPSPPAHSQFPEFSALRPFEGSLFDSQQMM